MRINKLIKPLLAFALLALFSALAAQNQYKFQYEAKLKKVNSFCEISTVDTLFNAGISQLIFRIKTQSLEFAYANIYMKSSIIDTAFSSDKDGTSNLLLISDTCDITISAVGYCPLQIKKFETRSGKKYCINVTMTPVISTNVTIISKQKLSRKVRKSIIEDVSIGRKNELIENKVCYILYEI